MKRPQKHLWTEAVLWLAAEICLNLSGMDTLANYSEFLLSQRISLNSSYLHTDEFIVNDGTQRNEPAIGLNLVA